MFVVPVVIAISGAAWAYGGLKQASLCAPASAPFKVEHSNGECVGTTDGSYVFAPQLKSVEQDIQAENETAVRSGNYVSVALLSPMTTGPGSVISMARITGELDGAYAEQYAANAPQPGRTAPLIQLVLANEGSTEQAWRTVVPLLTAMTGDAHLVAVIGMGVSVTQTVSGARMLSRGGVPMVGSVLTGDSLNWQHIPGLVSAVPDDMQQVTALGTYLRGHGYLAPPSSLFLVSDGQGSDLYTKSLRHDFKQVLGHYISYSLPYGPPGMSGQLMVIASQVCGASQGPTTPAPTVLYAGRVTLLPSFLDSLRSNGVCRHKQLTVVTGSDAAALPAGITAPQSDEGSLTVIYSGSVNPGLVTPTARGDFRRSRLHSAASLGNTWTIGSYNAMSAAVAATDLAAAESGGQRPQARSLFYYLRFLHGTDEVNGAAGPFGFSSPGGSLLGVSVPVMRMAGGGAPALVP